MRACVCVCPSVCLTPQSCLKWTLVWAARSRGKRTAPSRRHIISGYAFVASTPSLVGTVVIIFRLLKPRRMGVFSCNARDPLVQPPNTVDCYSLSPWRRTHQCIVSDLLWCFTLLSQEHNRFRLMGGLAARASKSKTHLLTVCMN